MRPTFLDSWKSKNWPLLLTAATPPEKKQFVTLLLFLPASKKLYLHGLPMSPIKSHQVAKKIKGLIGSCMMISGHTTRAKWSLETIRSRLAWNSGKWVCCRRWAKVRYQWGCGARLNKPHLSPFGKRRCFFWFLVFEVQGKNVANFLAINAIKIKNHE